ncbi:MAG: DUF21 domain-containing protein [Elusimicrobia bacterium]|nr:DUF21 domain-containing protein [Elusimicrobiota bacterium]
MASFLNNFPTGSPPWIIWAAWAACGALMWATNFGESAITSLSMARLKGLKAIYGGPFWEAARRWIYHPEEYFTVLLLVNNLLEAVFAWLLLTGIAFWIQAGWQREALVWIIGGAVNLFILTLYPKILGRRLSHSMAGVWILRALRLAIAPFYPFLRLFFWIIAKFTGAGQGGTLGKSVYRSFEERRELIELARQDDRKDLKFGLTAAASGRNSVPEALWSGAAAAVAEIAPSRPGVADMMAKYLRLKEVLVRDVMTPKARVSAIDAEIFDSSPPKSPQRQRIEFALMTDGYSRTLAVKRDVPIGYVLSKDILKKIASEIKKPAAVIEAKLEIERLSDLLRPIPALHERQKLINVLPLVFRGCPIAYVTDGRAWTGIVTAEDCLEEITGEILDEFETRKRRSRLPRPPPGPTGVRA